MTFDQIPTKPSSRNAHLMIVVHSVITRGKGIEDDPIRGVDVYSTIGGDILASSDRWEKTDAKD